MDCIAYQKEFEKKRARLKLPDDCKEIEPTIENVGFYFWTLTWFVLFNDSRYIRIWERWEKRAGLDYSRRLKFSFHYGVAVAIQAGGKPEWKSEDPVDIRIDNSTQPYHLHFGAQNPHYGQERIEGLQLEALDLFTFLKAIFAHRSKGTSLDRLLGFKIV